MSIVSCWPFGSVTFTGAAPAVKFLLDAVLATVGRPLLTESMMSCLSDWSYPSPQPKNQLPCPSTLCVPLPVMSNRALWGEPLVIPPVPNLLELLTPSGKV